VDGLFPFVVLLFQSFCYFLLSLSFESFHLSFSALICLIHWCRFIQLILGFNLVFVDRHSQCFSRCLRLASDPLRKCWVLITILIRAADERGSKALRKGGSETRQSSFSGVFSILE
jgi:hypothetical protein